MHTQHEATVQQATNLPLITSDNNLTDSENEDVYACSKFVVKQQRHSANYYENNFVR